MHTISRPENENVDDDKALMLVDASERSDDERRVDDDDDVNEFAGAGTAGASFDELFKDDTGLPTTLLNDNDEYEHSISERIFDVNNNGFSQDQKQQPEGQPGVVKSLLMDVGMCSSTTTINAEDCAALLDVLDAPQLFAAPPPPPPKGEGIQVGGIRFADADALEPVRVEYPNSNDNDENDYNENVHGDSAVRAMSVLVNLQSRLLANEDRRSRIQSEIEAQAERVRRAFVAESTRFDVSNEVDDEESSPLSSSFHSSPGGNQNKRQRKNLMDLTPLQRHRMLSRAKAPVVGPPPPPLLVTAKAAPAVAPPPLVTPPSIIEWKVFQLNKAPKVRARRQLAASVFSGSGPTADQIHRRDSQLVTLCSTALPSFASPPVVAGRPPQQQHCSGKRADLQSEMDTLLAERQNSVPDYVRLNPEPHTITVSKNDVLCCVVDNQPPGKGTNTGTGSSVADSLIGNRRFRVIVDLHRTKYSAANSEEGRRDVARRVVATVRRGVPPGRFLRRDPESGLWRESAEAPPTRPSGDDGKGEDSEEGEGGRERQDWAVEEAETALRESCQNAAAAGAGAMALAGPVAIPPMLPPQLLKKAAGRPGRAMAA